MNITHFGLEPVIYGLVIFLGLWSMWHKLTTGKILGFVVEVGVFWLVFALHGGSMTGGFAATIAALIAGSVLPRTFR